MAVTDDLNATIGQLTFNAYNNAPISQLLITQLQACAAQLSPGAPLDQLNDAINQLQWLAPNNAPVSIAQINQLTNVLSQLTSGAPTTNADDIAAIGQISTYILAQESDWGNLLWMNWDFPSTTLTVQVRGMYTMIMEIDAVPWWTNWDSYADAASDIISRVYGEYAMQQMASGVPLGDLFNLNDAYAGAGDDGSASG